MVWVRLGGDGRWCGYNLKVIVGRWYGCNFEVVVGGMGAETDKNG